MVDLADNSPPSVRRVIVVFVDVYNYPHIFVIVAAALDAADVV